MPRQRAMIPPAKATSKSKASALPTDNFAQRLYPILAAIPYGKVTTYGALARLAGSSRAARQVGGVLRRLPKDTTLPWYRVINSQGRISLIGEHYMRQKRKLKKEGIAFQADDSIDLKTFGWPPPSL